MNFPRAYESLTVFRFDVPHDCSVELSPKGYQFFTDIFETFDRVWILVLVKPLYLHLC